jgi:3-methylfumaryl-CoA hydratase
MTATDTDALDIDKLKAWIGRQEIVEDTLAPQTAAKMTATLDRDDPPPAHAAMPPLWHWTYFLPCHPQSELASDGHAKRGGFVPPVPLPRRMFAGARLTFSGEVRIGEPARRTSTIAGIELKHGRTGPLIFLNIRNEIAGAHGKVVEDQDIVYRDHPRPDEPQTPPKRPTLAPVWKREIDPDIMLLFRYSAMIFNAHRIHYDLDYVTKVEGYPGLIVHGPLIATLLADLVRRNTPRPLAAFRFRAIRPLFALGPFAVCGVPNGDHVTLWAQNGDGAIAMEAEAELATA